VSFESKETAMGLSRRQFLHLAAGSAALPAVSRVAWAQAYPNQPVRWIVGFAPGGAGDIQARIMGRWLAERLGRPVIIENKPGAGSNISVQSLIGLPADGHTLLFVSPAQAINSTLYETLPFSFLADTAPVAGLLRSPLVMEVNPSFPTKTVAEFITYAKANPGKISMASFGVGTNSHLAGELFKAMAGVDMVHVPYRGAAPALTDLIGGQVQVMFDVLAGSRAHIQAGRLRPLAVTTATRVNSLPDVPTVSETVSGYEANGWSGVAVRKGTSSETIERLNREINAGLANPAVKVQLEDTGGVPMSLTPAEFGALVTAETEKWAKVVKFAGVKAE
jgi:tripartite-type tricarboxylate transporter receptor subunit TctC